MLLLHSGCEVSTGLHDGTSPKRIRVIITSVRTRSVTLCREIWSSRDRDDSHCALLEYDLMRKTLYDVLEGHAEVFLSHAHDIQGSWLLQRTGIS